MHIAILIPELPPKVNGIGDYTFFLSQALVKEFDCQVTLLTSEGNFQCPQGCKLERGVFVPGAALLETLPKAMSLLQADWFLIQYNPFLYAHRGFNPWLIAAVAQIRSQQSNLKVALMAHEMYMTAENFKFAILGIFHRIQLWGLLRSVDLAFASIDTWAAELRRWMPNKPVFSLPVGSNVPVISVSTDALERLKKELAIDPSALVLGAFGSYHYGRMPERVLRTLERLDQRKIKVHLLFIGSGGEQLRKLCPTHLHPMLTTTGALECEAVSTHLQLVDLLISPFLDGISTRRSSAMSCLAHGLPLLTTSGRLSDALWHKAFGDQLIPVENEDAYFEAAYQLCLKEAKRRELAYTSHALYQNQFTWGQITQRLLDAFEKAERV
ncbi:MAG: glycosyltransferase [Anaerolineae bacterium]|nr:glycosyltransferase [Gloeobacterales cyanobacterium ES-bin-313]